jgi:hypothetical protein
MGLDRVALAPVHRVRGTMPELIEPSPRNRTTLFKLRARQCRFIVSDERTEAIFCGGETQDGSSWCPWHKRLVYTKPLVRGSGSAKAVI